MVVEDRGSTTPEKETMEYFYKSFIAGGIAGMCAKTAVAPLDRIKILLLAHNRHYKNYGVFSGLRRIVQKESVLGLYKGNGAQMLRVFPLAAVRFGSFELYKTFLKNVIGTSHSVNFFAGSLAGITSVMMTYPLDIARARLAFQVTGEHIYSGIYDTLSCMFRTEGGVRALYKGLIPTILGMIPYGGLSFYTFEELKFLCLEYIPNICGRPDSSNSGGLVLTVPAKLVCGGIAIPVAQTISYPLDVVRRKMQLSMMSPETERFAEKGFITTLIMTYREDGIVRGLYRGMTINYMRAIPMGAVSFSTYELFKQIFGLDIGKS
ncbi:solute carrier family 25 member 16-like isoform X1 [Argiope bruennichi]|uniref:Graves disease carrier protein like protein n=1 Tax=Argiope bruennichi TaxID=94029 RepID=A0A8T0E9R5_ARGBR|nr:solute carrier family 25 member 16-like isoform X1 [Argiope bruennichi]KAF8769862.1 Graves disease carrier protein like protein [Argiope bruennichi]